MSKSLSPGELAVWQTAHELDFALVISCESRVRGGSQRVMDLSRSDTIAFTLVYTSNARVVASCE